MRTTDYLVLLFAQRHRIAALAERGVRTTNLGIRVTNLYN